MQRNISTFLLCLVCLFFACKSVDEKPEEQEITTSKNLFNADSLLQHVKILSSDAFEGRRTGTKGSEKARNYIISKFKALDVMPLGENYEQPFTFEARTKSFDANNILGVIKGSDNSDKYIVISAHYDHEGIKKGEIYNGADDDASGTSALLAFAEYLAENKPNHSVILAAFDAEELGLVGAKHFVDKSIVPLDQIVTNINMDMISRSDDNILWVLGPRYNEDFKSLITSIDSTDTFKVKIGHEGLDDKVNWTNSSDQAAFHNKGIPFLFFTVDDHEDYHKPTDDFENIHPAFYIKSVSTIISIFEKIDSLKF